MLVSLSVKNFAIIDNIQIDFEDHMTVLTGETGAGKSLIIDAIGLLFGRRASADLIRYGENKAAIEGAFSDIPPKAKELLGDEIHENDYLVIRREIYANGKSLCKINNQMVSLSQLVEIAEELGDIHSQFDTQGLFNPKNYLQFIDDKTIPNLLEGYRQSLHEYQMARNEYQNLLKKNSEDTERLDFLKFQIAELVKANLSISEEEDLKQRNTYLNNFETIQETAEEFIRCYQEKKALDSIFESIALLSKLENFDPKYAAYKKQIEENYYNLSDAVENLIRDFRKVDFDSDELEKINDRLGLYSDLKRKYKKSTAEIIAYLASIQKEANAIENYDQILSDLENRMTVAYQKTLGIAQEIRNLRLELAKKLETEITAMLADLQLKNTEFRIVFHDLNKIEFHHDGIDEIDFLISFNKGEPLRPLSKVASGGELSRFMLALKTKVSEKLDLQMIVFDEIDNGVSGAIAYSIANKIKTISRRVQVLCVTHLPQVAAIADHQLNIQKHVDQENRTVTKIRTLNTEERISEIAKMISNGSITEAGKALASELLKK